ncbi:MAG: copper chaperone PCu(A)C [Gammaproteobacteria bacterium]|nr:copper chaperone PCu(A)C [Gammaproteobacteria bacterium]
MVSFGHTSYAELEIDDAWIRSGPPNSKTFAGYLKFTNKSSTEISIKELKSNAFEKIEMHSSFTEDGISSMKKLNALEIPANSTLNLKPGGYHLMLNSPNKMIKESDLIELMIYFEVEGSIKILRSDAMVLRNGYE